MRIKKDKLTFYTIFLTTSCLRFFPTKLIHLIGKILGYFLYFILKDFRKRALSNLALAEGLSLSNKQIKKTALKSFQNLAINCLEYSKFYFHKDFSKIIACENPSKAENLYKKGQGIIFFCAHQSNWEVLFLDGNTRMKGIAIGKPFKNKFLYDWIVSIREKTGGKIINPKDAIKIGLRSLRKGKFFGILCDQGMPESNYTYPFLGRNAKSSTAPALLAYKTNSPIIVATTKRKNGKYLINYSDPIWPDLSNPIDTEVKNMMDRSLCLIEKSIKKNPSEWLWQHNRWKTQSPKNIYRKFRHDSICLIIDETFDEKNFPIEAFKEIYKDDNLYLISPKDKSIISENMFKEIIYYQEKKDLFRLDYRFKLIFNFTKFKPLKRHYLKLSAFEVLSVDDIYKYAMQHTSSSLQNLSFSDVLKRAICRPNTLWSENAS